MIDFLLGSHEFLGNHTFPEFLVGYIFGAALIIGAPTVFLLLAFTSALMKTNGKMGGYREYEDYGESTLNDCPPFILPDRTNQGNISTINKKNDLRRKIA
tara:strand:- start:444 stop:743 length:300 start_codon:yes stop_codon:yes gene_type:complete